MNNFSKLVQSTLDLHNRFGTAQTVEQSQQIFTEEYNEVLDAVSQGESVERISQEFVDAIVTVIGIFRSLFNSDNIGAFSASTLFFMIKSVYELYIVIRKNNVKPEDIEKAMVFVIEKNNNKSLGSHEFNSVTGKITRKVIRND